MRRVIASIVHDPGVDQPYADVVARAMELRADDDPARSSYHKIVGPLRDGTPMAIVHCVPYGEVAWHTGRASHIPGTDYRNEWVNRMSVGVSYTLAVPYELIVRDQARVCRELGLIPAQIHLHRTTATLRTDARQVLNLDQLRRDVAALL